jgi:hypothetical protein
LVGVVSGLARHEKTVLPPDAAPMKPSPMTGCGVSAAFAALEARMDGQNPEKVFHNVRIRCRMACPFLNAFVLDGADDPSIVLVA